MRTRPWLVPGTLALALGATLAAGTSPLLAEETPREAVERLLPDLMGDEDAFRERAEKELLALGEPGRAELERLSRDPDPRRAITALRLLRDDRWDRAPARRGGAEERARPARPVDDDESAPADPRWRALRDDVERRMDEMRRRMAEMQRDFEESWPRAFEFGIEPGGPLDGRASVSSSGRVVEDGRSFGWSIDASGRVKVTTKDAPDAAETAVEAESLEALRKDHPDLARRLDEVAPRPGVRRFVFRTPRNLDRFLAPDDETAQELRIDTPTLPGSVLGIHCAPVPEILSEHLGLEGRGLVVESVLPKSLAERLGLRRLDVVLELAGRKLASVADVREALASVKEGETVAAVVLRKGRRETLSSSR